MACSHDHRPTLGLVCLCASQRRKRQLCSRLPLSIRGRTITTDTNRCPTLRPLRCGYAASEQGRRLRQAPSRNLRVQSERTSNLRRYCCANIGVPPDPRQRDPNAGFEVYLDGRWYAFNVTTRAACCLTRPCTEGQQLITTQVLPFHQPARIEAVRAVELERARDL